MQTRKGVTIIELMVAVLILSLIATVLFRSYLSGSRAVHEITENHVVNEKIDRTMQMIINDIREANVISSEFPPIVEEADLPTLSGSDLAKNRLKFVKIFYDFTKDPSTLSSGEVNYTKHEVEYFLDADGDNPGKWILSRSFIAYDNKGSQVTAQASVFPILSGLEECVFYRLKDPDASRTGNLYIKFKLARIPGDTSSRPLYTNERLITVRERGASPEL